MKTINDIEKHKNIIFLLPLNLTSNGGICGFEKSTIGQP